MFILGISCYYHDSAAALISNGEIMAAVQEERFTRIKQDSDFPINAINYCLSEAKIKVEDIDYVVFYDKPFLKFSRILHTYFAYAPTGLKSYLKAIPLWLKKKLFIKDLIAEELNYKGKFLFAEHHQSHAASAFFPSPFQKAAFLTIDGVGEWATTSYGIGDGNNIKILKEIHFPHSLGLLYSAFTYFTGFKVNSGEYKLMGLSPYGEPKYVNTIYENLIDVKDDGSFRLNLEYFDYCAGLKMTGKKFDKLFGGPRRKPESYISQREMDMAASIQVVTEEIVEKMAKHIKEVTGEKYLCLAGGVALNCVANGRLLKNKIFENIWIQPAAGDAGGALGAALLGWYQYLGKSRQTDNQKDSQKGSYLGPEFTNTYIKHFLDNNNVKYEYITDEKIPEVVADLIDQQNVIGWCQGRMEFGPRALGHRSIIGDARSPKMQSIMNLKIKFRESFRPFAPSCLEECASEFFEFDNISPYMLLVAPIKKDRQQPMPSDKEVEDNIEAERQRLKKEMEELKKLGRTDELKKVQSLIDNKDYIKFRTVIHASRSDVPAITHLNYTGRLQTVSKETNPLYWEMINKFKEKTGYGIIINTSFNVRGEPIVCTPSDAYVCFCRTEMDYLIVGNYLVDKKKQTEIEKDTSWMQEFQLD